MTTQLSTINFHNQSLITFEQDGTFYTAMKPICENIGLAWEAQLARIKRDEVLSSIMIVMIIVAEDGKKREMICLPIDYLNGWLFGIDVKRCKPEIRELLITYKKECYKALADYWMKGKEEHKTTVDDRTGLRDAVNMLVSKKGLIYSEAYHLVHQRFNVQSIEELTKDQLPQAVEYVHKICLEGELIIDDKRADENFLLSDDERCDLAWCWFSAKQQNDLLRELIEPLEKIQSGFASKVWTFANEYKRCWEEVYPTIKRLVENADPSSSISWQRIINHIEKNEPKVLFNGRRLR